MERENQRLAKALEGCQAKVEAVQSQLKKERMHWEQERRRLVAATGNAKLEALTSEGRLRGESSAILAAWGTTQAAVQRLSDVVQQHNDFVKANNELQRLQQELSQRVSQPGSEVSFCMHGALLKWVSL